MNIHIYAILALTVIPAPIMAVPSQSDSNDSLVSIDPLRVAVYGATGRVGSRVVAEALNRGHQVTAITRDPEKLEVGQENVSVVQGDILDVRLARILATGHDAIVVSVRGSADDSYDPEQAIQRAAVEVLVGVLEPLGDSGPRLILVGGAGSLETGAGVRYVDSIPRLFRATMSRSLRQEIYGQILTLEYLRETDSVNWTYLSPPKKFKPGKRTGTYRIGGDQMLADAKGRSVISMEDYAVALVDELDTPRHTRTRFTVAY